MDRAALKKSREDPMGSRAGLHRLPLMRRLGEKFVAPKQPPAANS
jgi:hypothetical protein